MIDYESIFQELKRNNIDCSIEERFNYKYSKGKIYRTIWIYSNMTYEIAEILRKSGAYGIAYSVFNTTNKHRPKNYLVHEVVPIDHELEWSSGYDIYKYSIYELVWKKLAKIYKDGCELSFTKEEDLLMFCIKSTKIFKINDMYHYHFYIDDDVYEVVIDEVELKKSGNFGIFNQPFCE